MQMAKRCLRCSRWYREEELGFPCRRCGALETKDFATWNEIASDKEAAARELAHLHFLAEPSVTQVFRLAGSQEAEGRPEEPIKLLEINPDSFASGILPLHFAAAPERGIPYPSIIVEVTPDEFDLIRSRKLTLPPSWEIQEEISRDCTDASSLDE
jgi:hypothetical protein